MATPERRRTARGKSAPSDPINRDNNKAFSELASSLRNHQVTAMVGAGISAACGYPTWDKLLDILHKKSRANEITRLHKDILWRAEEYRQRLGEKRYRRLLSQLFQPRLDSKDDVVRTLVRLPFRHFLTTNYDDTLARAHRGTRSSQRLCVIDWSDEDAVRRFITGLGDPEQPRHCVHLHGRFTHPESIVLTDTDYTTRYARTTLTTRKLFAVLATQRVLFVGFSLEDPDLANILREVNAALGSEEPRHFALLPLDRDNDDPRILRPRLRRKFGIDPIFYPSTDDHQLLQVVLDRLERNDSGDAPVSIPPLQKRNPVHTKPIAVPPDPDDIQKGRFGGRAEVNGRLLRARVVDTHDGWCVVTLEVLRRTGEAIAIGEKVEFHLHQTFHDNPRIVSVKNQRAVLEIDAWGAFTVGAKLVREGTQLELDLATLTKAPKKFRES